MDEYIDILNDYGEISGKTCLKSEAHKNGFFHQSAHIWIFDKNKNVLIQKRAADKDTFPNLWDISVAGHISAGELPIDAAIREVEEEIGFTISENQLHFISTFRKKIAHSTNLIDNELHHIYICHLNYKLDSLNFQEAEVSALNKIPLNLLKKNIQNNTLKFVPHGANYFKLVFEAIQNYKK